MDSIYNTILLAEKSLEELYYQGQIIDKIDNNIDNIEKNITLSEKIVNSMKSLYSRIMYSKNDNDSDIIQMSNPIYDIERQKDNEHFSNNPIETLKLINLKINEQLTNQNKNLEQINDKIDNNTTRIQKLNNNI